MVFGSYVPLRLKAAGKDDRVKRDSIASSRRLFPF